MKTIWISFILLLFGLLIVPSIVCAKADVELEDENMQLILAQYNDHEDHEELKIRLKKEEKIQLGEIIYHVEDEDIVSVNSEGLVVANRVGATDIKVSVSYRKNGREKKTVLTQNVKVIFYDGTTEERFFCCGTEKLP